MIDKMKELMAVLIGDAWDLSSNMNGYNRNKIIEGYSGFSNDEKFGLASCGFYLSYNILEETFFLSLHLGTSHNFYGEILKKIKENFSEIQIGDGRYTKYFIFTNKNKYYENDYLRY